MKMITTKAMTTESARSRAQARIAPVSERRGGKGDGWRAGTSLMRLLSRGFGIQQTAERGERHRALVERPTVELRQVEFVADELVEFVAHAQPAAPAHEVGRQLAGRQLGALQLGRGFL